MRPASSTAARAATIVLTTTLAAACGPDLEERKSDIAAAERMAIAAVDQRIDNIEERLAEQVGLTAALRSELREHLNPEQVATARQLGVGAVEDSAEARALLSEGELVPLEDSTEYWVVRDLTHSMPYVTPDTRAMLTELGRSFHARLDSLGLPAFRFEISSVLRTGAMQASLRRGNPNASRTTSSHEFGTTIDIAYNVFSPPADLTPLIDVQLPESLELASKERDRVAAVALTHARQRVAQLGEDRAAELKGILGEVLAGMQDARKVQPLIERSQPVFHMTVATRYDDSADRPARAE